MKLLRILADQADADFPEAADDGEWAVPGTFVFAGDDPDELDPEARLAFDGGFLGLESFGWAARTVVTDASREDYEGAIMALARHLQQDYGAPDFASARAAAKEEIDYAASLCEAYPPGAVLSLGRVIEDGAIREEFWIETN